MSNKTNTAPTGIKGHAVVYAQVEITLTQPWSRDATLEQIHRQGKREALERFRRLEGIKVTGEPTVRAIVVDANDLGA